MFLIYAVVIAIMFSYPLVRNRISELTKDFLNNIKAGSDATYGKIYTGHVDRIYMWRWAFDLFVEHPLIGVGTGGYRQAILKAGGERGPAHPHNNFLYMAVSFGILGIAVFIWFFWILFRNGWRNRDKPVGYFILATGLVIFVGGFTDTHILDAGPAFLLAATTGLQAALPKCGVGAKHGP